MSDLMFILILTPLGYDAAFGQRRGRITALSAWLHAQSKPLLRGKVLPGVPPLILVPLVMGAGGRCCSALLRLPTSPGCLILFIFSYFFQSGLQPSLYKAPLCQNTRETGLCPRLSEDAGEELGSC